MSALRDGEGTVGFANGVGGATEPRPADGEDMSALAAPSPNSSSGMVADGANKGSGVDIHGAVER